MTKKKSLKKIAVLFLAALLILIVLKLIDARKPASAVIPSDAEAELNFERKNNYSKTVNVGGVEYSYYTYEDNTANIYNIKLSSAVSTLTIPATLDGHKVKSLGWNCEKSINGGILYHGTIIDGSAETVIVSDGIERLENNCFYFDTFKYITIPDSVTYIGNSAFALNRSLKSVKIPAKITVLSDSLFWYCEALEEVTLPDGLTEIGSSAFRTCYALKEIKIPDTVKTIHQLAFVNCTSLKEIILPRGLQQLPSIKEHIYLCEANVRIYCYRDTKIQKYLDQYNIDYYLVDPNVLRGDINLDKAIDNKDLIILRKYLADSNYMVFTDLQFSAADISTDGVIDNKDLLAMRKHLADSTAYPIN